MNQNNDKPQFARGRNEEKDTVELRVEVPKSVMAVIDANWMVRGGSRASVVNQVLGNWHMEEIHAASVTMKLQRGNPDLMELPVVESGQ